VRVLLAHVRAGTLELVHYPAYSLPTLLFPTFVFLLFVVPQARSEEALVTAAFAAIAVLGVAFFQFGVGIAMERASPWEPFLRTLPAGARVRIGARVFSALLFATASVSVLLATSLATTDFSLPAGNWLRFVGVLLLGAIPFALLGITLGYWVRPKAALPVANLLFLPLSFMGGLWGGARHLPDTLGAVSPYLPTRQWANLLWASVGEQKWRPLDVAGLAGYALLFALLAAWGYRRDEGERYS